MVNTNDTSVYRCHLHLHLQTFKVPQHSNSGLCMLYMPCNTIVSDPNDLLGGMIDTNDASLTLQLQVFLDSPTIITTLYTDCTSALILQYVTDHR